MPAIPPWAAYVLLAVAMTFAVSLHTHIADQNRIRAEIGICERLKADRIHNARNWTRAAAANAATATSQSGDRAMRERARRSAEIYRETATAMRERLWLCGPLIRHGRFEIDHRAVRIVQGADLDL